MLLSAHQIPWVKKKKEKLENAMDYSVTFCNVNFLRLWLELIRWIELLQLLMYKDVLEFLCKTKCPFCLVYHFVYFGRRNNSCSCREFNSDCSRRKTRR